MKGKTKIQNLENGSIFEVYAKIYYMQHEFIEDIDETMALDKRFYTIIKEIISKLVDVDPAKRMKLKEARNRLIALIDLSSDMNDFLLLKLCF